MTTKSELKKQIENVIEQCGPSNDQQAVKAVLLALMSAMAVSREFALLDHVCKFSEREIAAIHMMQARENASRN